MRSSIHLDRREVLVIAFALIITTFTFASVKPRAIDPATPLPWDAAGHYLRALEVRDALRTFSPVAVTRSLLAADLYPFGHPLALGIWIALAGESGTSAFLFQLLTLWSCVLGAWLCCRQAERGRALCSAGAVAVVLASAPLVGLSASYMVETLAVGASLFGIAAITSALGPRATSPAPDGSNGRSPWRRSALVAVGVAAPLLTKYNVGLPIAAAGLGISIWEVARGRARRGVPVLTGAALGLGLWALFLTAQHDGWRNFFEFARNRANSIGWTPLARIGWYGRLFSHEFVGGWPVTLVIALLAAVGFIRHRTPLTTASGLALIASVGALAIHPYLLDRSLVGPAALLSLPAGCGFAVVARAIPQTRPVARRVVAIAWLGLAVLTVLLSIPRARIWERRLDDRRSAELAPLSRFVEESFRGISKCRVLGSFNEFSLGWARILWHRTHGAGAPDLAGDFAYPLGESRSGLDGRPDSAYTTLARDWRTTAADEAVLTIQVADGSRWDTQDYQLWNKWKRNEIGAVASLPGVRSVARFTSDDGSVQASLLKIGPDLVAFGSGWGPAEPWGRWALGHEAELQVAPTATPSHLVLRFAAFEGLVAAQQCTVRVDGKVAGSFSVSGPAWQWRECPIPLPESSADHTVGVKLRFAGLWPGYVGDPILRALPFACISVESGAIDADKDATTRPRD